MKKVLLVFTLLMMFSVLKSSAQNSTCATAAPLTIGGTMCSGTSGGSNTGDPTGNDDTDGNVCSSNYSGGDDFIFEYTATTTDALKLDLFATNSWTGLLVTAGCPTTGTCFASSTSSSANESLTTPAMTIGQVYYIHISTWPSPQSAGQFCLDAVLQTPPMPPANDDCADAEPLTVNADLNCTATTSGTILLASASGEDETTCGGTEDDDVWYSFVATATSHTISLINVANGTTDLYHSVWSGTCGALTNILCSDPNSSTASGLTIGETYLLRVYSWTSTPGQTTTFDVCIGTLPPPPANDDCADAEPLTVNADLNCTATTSGTIASATASGEDETTCFGTEDDDVWYSFVATATSHEIDLINVANGTTDLYHSVWSGTCGSLTNILCSDPNSSTASGLTIGETYLLRVYSWTSTPGQTTTFDVCIGTLPPPPTNDDCGNAISITAGGTATGSTASASNIENLTSCSGGGNGGFCSGGGTGGIDFGAGVWYVYTSSVSGETITASTDNPGTNFDTEIQIFEGSCGALTCVGGDDDGGSVNLSSSSVLCWVSTGTPTQPVDYYIYVDGHGSNTGNYELTLMAESAAAFTAPADLCLNAGVQTGLGGGTSVGGVYSGPGVTDDGNGLTYSFDPAGAGVGVHTLTYTISPTNSASDDVEVFALPTVAFTALADLCENAGVQTGLSGGTPTAGAMETGLYSGTGVTDDGNNMTYSFDPAAAGVGTHTITYTFTTASGCVGTATDDVEVFAVPVVTFTALGDLSISAGVQNGLGSGSPTGGVYSGPGVTDDGNGMTYSFDPSAAGSGVHTLTYSFTNSDGCTGSADDDVEVFGLFQITCPTDLVIPECTSSADSAILVQDFLNSFSFTGGTNASAAFDPFTVAAMCVGGQTVVTYVVTDDTGSDFCIRNIFVNADVTAPTFTTACPADISVECDQPVPAAATLEATDNCQATPDPAIFINEIHYDNTGGDVDEFVEVAGSAGLDLAGYSVVLYNGSNGTAYNTINLSGTIDDEGTGFGALEFFQNGLQNGAPDGLALVDAGGNVLEFLNYEGSTITATNGPASGMTSINIGVSEPGSTPVGESLQRTGTGGVGSDFTWTGPLANSAGSLNAGQTVTAAAPPPIPVVFEETFVAGCGITGVITRTWTATDACGNEEVCTQIVTIQDTTDPTFVGTLPGDVTIECDESAPAPEMLMAMDNCPSASTMVTFINEIHYDNTGGDVGEFFEIAGSAGLDLSGYQVALYNGSNGGVYNTINLTGVIPDEGTGFGAIDFQLPANGLQNGSPDGLALVDAGGMVIEFLSYEGTITASGGPAVGLTSTDIGVEETGGALIGESLQRTGMGGMGSDFTWVGPLTETPGLLNAGQTVMANLAPIAVTFSENFVAGGCGSTGVTTRTYTATDACGNEVEHIQTITVEDNTPPSFLGTLPMDITVECDDVPAPANLSAVDNCGAGLMVWINEFHYDNTGGDVGEFIEVAGFAGIDLSAYTLVLYNGNNGFSYNTLTLSGVIPDEGAGFGAVSFSLPLNGLQNGAPDGIALAQGITALQFISYEGSFVAMNGPAGGMTSMDIGVSEPGGTPVGQSLQLIGTGSTYADFTWTGPVAESPGLLNVDQNAEGNITPVFEETSVPGGCAGESTITRTWTVTDDCGNTMIHVQTITVEDNTAPQVACQNITIQLDENGEAEILPSEINDPNASTSTSVVVGNAISQLPAELKANVGFCPTPAVSTNTCDCPSGFVAVGYSGLVGNSYGAGVISQFALHCKEVMPNGDLGTSVTVTCSNGSLVSGTDSGPLLATGNDVLVGGELRIGCAIDGVLGYSKPISEILAGDPSTNSTAITALGGMGGTANPAMYVPAGSVIVGMETFEDPNPGFPIPGIAAGVAWRYASLSEISGPTEDNCADPSSLTYTLSQSLFTCADVGENLVTLSVTDPCGNTGTCTAIVTVEDNIPPVVTCPDNIYVHLDPGACDAIVTWNPATATDACGIASVEQTGGPVSGTTFDRNTTTTISYEVTDVNGNTASCSFTIEIIEFVPDSDYITCNNLVNITLDENCEATVGADQVLEGNNYGCYDDYIVTFADTGLPVVLDGSHIGNTYEVMVVGPAGIPCWGSIFVEDKLIPDLICTDVTVRCDDDTTPGAGYVSVSDMVAPTMSVDNATVSETVTFGAENSDVVDVNVVVTSNHTWVGDLVISITSPSGTTVELMNNIGGPGFGCAGDGLDLVFDDAATLTYADLDGTCNNNPAAEGTFQPLEALSAFNGEPAAGDWTISVTDLATGDSGDVDVTINLSANSTIPFPVPATATIIPQGNNTYTVLDFDPCGSTTLVYTDVESGELCDGDRTITREWVATDESGNTTSCTQTISITPVTVEDVAADIPEDVTIDCGDALPPVLTDIGCSNIGIGLDGEPTIIDVCDGSYKLLRKYILINWCDNSTLEFTQIIKVLDTTAPSITCPADITISTNSSDCLGAIQLPIATATDACSSDITISVSNVSSGNYNPSINAVSGLSVGAHTVTYTATDGCGNESSCYMTITVEDQVAPIAICDEHTVLGIGSDGTAFIDAITFDDGSSDNCGIVEMTARRMDNPACPGFDGTDFLPSVPFYCCDVNTTVMVEFRVRDAAGNVNSCMVEVDVEDKIDPTISCPADQDVECSATYLDYIEVGQPLPADAIAANGEAVASDNCPGVTVTNNVISNTIDCGTGIITIVWTATDAGGRTTSCIQRYFIDNSAPFNIVDTEHRNYLPLDQLGPNGEFHTLTDGVEWPADYEATTCGTGLEPEDLSSPYNYPIIYEGACNNIAVGHHDQVLDFGAADACLKILRKWYVVDWCQAASNQDPTQPGPGVWHYTQIIKVVNSSAPTISCEPDNGIDMYPNYDEDCGPAFIELKAVAQDDCTPSNLLEFTWALSDGQTGVGSDASQELNNGDYTITFTVTDLCGNATECTRSFTVFDAKKPTPVCIFGIATTVMPSSGAVTIWASDFESGSSYDNCTAYEDLQFSFSQDVTIDNITISCDDIPADGLVPVSIYVTDEAGNFDFCSTFINVQDPTGVCVGPASTIKGSIETEDQEMVEDVNVNLTDNNGLNIPVVTGANGTYEFNMMPGDQEVTPTKDINYLNGVTTYDLVLISKHILGTDLLDSPYKVIAADANNSQTVTTLDIVKLRALILYIDDELTDNNSWRFVDNNYIFPNPINPWQEDFPEYIAIDGSFDPANFIGVKVGDVNGTASPNSLLGSDTRTFDGTLALQVDAKKVGKGETFTIDFRARDFKNISGYQFTLGFDQTVVEFVDVISNLENLGINNFGLTKLKDGIITTSWNNSKGISVEDNSILFSMKFVANNTITTDEVLKINSQFTASEAYNEGNLYEVVLAYNGNEISNGFELFQNSPNPFKSETTISFNMPEAEEVTLKIYDISGRVLKLQKMNATKGFNSIDIKRGELDGAGVLYYQLETATEIGVKKMILVN